MLSKTQVAERLSQLYEEKKKKRKKNTNSQQPAIQKTLMSKLEGGRGKQIYKQIHNVRKQPKP